MHNAEDDVAPTDDAPSVAITDPMWGAAAHLTLNVLAYLVLLVWVSFAEAECPRK
jgi:hypothetical protein